MRSLVTLFLTFLIAALALALAPQESFAGSRHGLFNGKHPVRGLFQRIFHRRGHESASKHSASVSVVPPEFTAQGYKAMPKGAPCADGKCVKPTAPTKNFSSHQKKVSNASSAEGSANQFVWIDDDKHPQWTRGEVLQVAPKMLE